MTDKPSLALQHGAVLHIITANKTGTKVSEDVINYCYAAIESIKWVERNAAVIREVHRLIREAPVVAEVLREWPGARIEELK
jgi:hypothetical protein